MRTFKIHISGTLDTIQELRKLGIESITVHLLRPDGLILETVHMTAFVKKFTTYDVCKEYVDTLLRHLNTPVFRVKIDCAYYHNYAERSVYIESHFKSNVYIYPTSLSHQSGKVLATTREYDKRFYRMFRERFKDHEIELCLYDDCIRQDSNWFSFYKEQN